VVVVEEWWPQQLLLAQELVVAQGRRGQKQIWPDEERSFST
jgi:hypothetical protein